MGQPSEDGITGKPDAEVAAPGTIPHTTDPAPEEQKTEPAAAPTEGTATPAA